MRGIDPIPIPVGNHFLNADGKADLATANREALTIMFMVPPGIKTLANALVVVNEMKYSFKISDHLEQNLSSKQKNNSTGKKPSSTLTLPKKGVECSHSSTHLSRCISFFFFTVCPFSVSCRQCI